MFHHNHHHHHKNPMDHLFKKASGLFHHDDDEGDTNTQQTADTDVETSHTAKYYLARNDEIEEPGHVPRGDCVSLKDVIHGPEDPTPYLDPLDDNFRHEIIKYGEFIQGTYDAFDFNTFSDYCGSCLYSIDRMFEQVGLARNGYVMTKYLYAMSRASLPRWLEKSWHPNAWNYDSNWIGYMAVSNDEETARIGIRDIVVPWRGTMAAGEWLKDFEFLLQHIGPDKDDDIKVEHGFYSLYSSKSDDTRYNQTSAQDQFLTELRRLVNFFRERGEQVSVTTTGHSLGAALAYLAAYDAALEFQDLPVTVITFGGPRVGNNKFCDYLEKRKVKAIRVVVKHDFIPRMPGIVFNKELEKIEEVADSWHWLYTHYGHVLEIDVESSPYLNHKRDSSGYHNLELHLHLIDGHISSSEMTKFRENAKRDAALVNKSCGMLKEETLVPSCWYQPAFKGLVRNQLGRWIIPPREPEDIPPPPDTVTPLSVFE
ncbi:Alpha/beta-Hydrolases superfamily protein [Rhynchospora pubera]|uniref:Alpha/beta-Hydrolases superfamily protein n=1 Tax=Rhynchospora pubera TaxID=906938 RepID=A0AAV8EMP6_9POAL|nr:Alpha/beta-Hydrolases superfamily protein [Rhynchospora pubera]